MSLICILIIGLIKGCQCHSPPDCLMLSYYTSNCLLCMWLCVFNQANKSQSLRCEGGLINTLPAAGGETGGESSRNWKRKSYK